MITKHPFRKHNELGKSCAFCEKQFTASNTGKEHIIPNAIGGRKTISSFICVDCNNSTGTDWDKALVNQLAPLCTMLNIKRGRRSNQNFNVETINGRKLTIRPDGSMTIAQPVVDVRNLGDKTEIKIQARTMKEFKSLLSGLQKKYPQIDIDEMIKKATDEHEYSSDPYRIPFEYGGLIAGRSVIKSCLAMVYEAGLHIDKCEHAKSYLLCDGNACFGYFNEYDVVTNRPEKTFFHGVYVCGDPVREQILAYVEYFGFLRIVACLSSNYIGDTFSCGYAVDPVSGKELDLKFNLDIAPEEISEIYAYKKVNNDETKRALDTLFAYWSELDQERTISNAIEYALDIDYADYGVKPGNVPTVEQAEKIFRDVTARFEPFLQHLSFGRMFSPEDMCRIVNESQKLHTSRQTEPPVPTETTQ